MKRNSLTILVGVLLLAIFGLLLFAFQVRQTDIALVTTFDKASRYITEPGFYWKWPPPIQEVYKFDKRVQTLDQDKIEETITRDNFNLIVQVYMGWAITKPDLFFSSFPSGTAAAAQPALEDLIRGAKSAVVGKHPFTDFVSTNPKELKFVEIEKEMLDQIQPVALKNYGIDVKFLGIKMLRLPESVTQKVFERMTAERKTQQAKLESQGQLDATRIKSQSDRESADIIAAANAQATAIKGQADAEAAKSFVVFNEAPELAKFLLKVRALEEVTKDRTSLFLDARTSPLDLFVTNFWQNASTNGNATLSTNAVLSEIEGKQTASKNAP